MAIGVALPRNADKSAQLEYRNVAFPVTVFVELVAPPTATLAAITACGQDENRAPRALKPVAREKMPN